MPPSQINDLKAQDTAREALRIQEMKVASDKARKDLATAQGDFASVLAIQREKWALEEQKHAERVKDMGIEVTALEKRKEQALIPIDLYKREADELYASAKDMMMTVTDRKLRVEELAERLEGKLDALGEREQNIGQKESQLVRREKGIALQEEMDRQRATSLAEALNKFASDRVAFEREMSSERETLVMRERSLSAKEQTLKRTEEALQIQERQLQDERGTLERAFKRLSPLKEM